MELMTKIKIAIGTIGYIAWAILVYFDPPQRAEFLHFNMAMVTGTIGLVLRDMSNTAPTNKQSGRAQPVFLLLLVAILLAGCAGVQQAVSGYNAAAARGLRAAEDTNIEMWTFNVCATPFSAAVRHPEVIAAMRALCLPNGAAGSPASLLDAVQVPK